MSRSGGICNGVRLNASMKVPPKRKGNSSSFLNRNSSSRRLNESPSEKEGKCTPPASFRFSLNPSMKVPPKRKGKSHRMDDPEFILALNESPSEKEGKYQEPWA